MAGVQVAALPNSLIECAITVLNTPAADDKRDLTLEVCRQWQSGTLALFPPLTDAHACTLKSPDNPARPADVEVIPPGQTPKRGKGGSLASRIAMIHALVHIENVAIDLCWDIIARYFSADLPKEFYDDFVKMAQDEARHYNMLHERLKAMGSHYGALPGHAGLWESAQTTFDSVLARLCIEHIVQEGHGLDVTPKTIARLRSAGDAASGDLLEVILRDEITHVTAGIKWFSYLCKRDNKDPIKTFHEMVPQYFHGKLKPPFNVPAREAAGMTPEWYEPLAQQPPTRSPATSATATAATTPTADV